jgi:hypothetical protein
VPTEPQWHPSPTAADVDSGGKDWEVVMEVMKVSEVMKAMEVREVTSWKEGAMMERMYATPSAGRAKVVWPADVMVATKAVHAAAAEAMASKTAHRVGGQWRGKHRHHDSTSDCYFAEHDNPPDCQRSHRAI